MTEPPDAERDGRAERWRRAKPLLTRRLRSRRVGDVRVAPDLASAQPPRVRGAAGGAGVLAVGWIVAPPSGRRTRGVVVNALGVLGYVAWWRRSGA